MPPSPRAASPRSAGRSTGPALPLERLYFEATPPIDPADLGHGARLLVPVGAAFGAPQLVRHGVFWDWVRKQPDAYWEPGDRTSTHAGVDLGFFVRRGAIYAIPERVPVRAVLAGRVERTGRRSDPESTHGIVLRHAGRDRLFVYTHYADVQEHVRPGERVRRGQVIGHARPFSRRFPSVLVHFAMGLFLQGWGPDPLDPTPLLRRWKVKHPQGSSCAADELNTGAHGTWESPGEIRGLVPLRPWDPAWRDVYR